MLKVLIADDEEKICQLIIKLINWEEMGLTVAATASNGLEALEQAEIYKPEIVITDIRMPGIDGMELIQKVKEKLPDTEIIIISGYRHFEYAQTAIRYGVRDYLLKPIKKEELKDTLQRITEIYKEKNEQLNFEERVRLALKNDAGKLRTSFVSRVIYGERDMPTGYNSTKTIDNAEKEATALKIAYHKGSIQKMVDDMKDQFMESFGFDVNGMPSLVQENLQARIRGFVLNGISSMLGGVVVNNANMVEASLGYCTLYGDSIGNYNFAFVHCDYSTIYNLTVVNLVQGAVISFFKFFFAYVGYCITAFISIPVEIFNRSNVF